MFQKIGDQWVHTAAFGHGDEVILGISGWIGTWELWQPPFEILSAAGWRTIAYDHYGAGEIRVPPELLTFEAQVDLVFDVLDAHGVDRCVLAGESYGGAVAVAAATRAPERVSGLVLVSAVHHGFADVRTRRFVQQLRADFEAVVVPFVDFCTPERGVEHVRSQLRAILRKADPETAARLVEAMYPVDVRLLLAELTVPTMVVHGDEDAIHPLPVAAQAARLVNDSSLVVLPGTGHVPTLTRPLDVAEAMAEFLTPLVAPLR